MKLQIGFGDDLFMIDFADCCPEITKNNDYVGHPVDGFVSLIPALEASTHRSIVSPRVPLAPLGRLEVSAIAVGVTDPAVAEFAGTYEGGVVRYGPKVGLAKLVASICLAFTEAPIAIMQSSREQTELLTKQLKLLGVDLNRRGTTLYGDGIKRIVMGTPYDFADDDIEFNKRAIVVFPEVGDAIHRRCQDRLLGPDRHYRLIGFLSKDALLSPVEQFHAVGIFGVHQLVVPCHGYVRRDVFVDRRTLNSCLRNCGKCIDFVRDERRNRRIAGKIREWSREQEGVRHAEGIDRLVAVCSNVRQALALQGHLDNFELYVGHPVDTDMLPPSMVERLSRTPRKWFDCDYRRGIASLAGLPQLRPSAPSDVLTVVWTSDGPVIPDAIQAMFDVRVPDFGCSVRPGVLIDVVDRVDPVRRQWAHQRALYARDIGFIPRSCRSVAVGRGLAALKKFEIIP